MVTSTSTGGGGTHPNTPAVRSLQFTHSPTSKLVSSRYSQPDDFYIFPDFPLELRQVIFAAALPDLGPRIIQMLEGDPSRVPSITLGADGGVFEVLSPAIPLLRVNQEARAVVHKHYGRLSFFVQELVEQFINENGQNVWKHKNAEKVLYMNFDTDKLIFRPSSTTDLRNLFTRLDVSNLKSFVLAVDSNLTSERRFPRLKKIFKFTLENLPALLHLELVIGTAVFDENYPARPIHLEYTEEVKEMLEYRVHSAGFRTTREDIRLLRNTVFTANSTIRFCARWVDQFVDSGWVNRPILYKFSLPLYLWETSNGNSIRVLKLYQTLPGGGFMWRMPVGIDSETEAGKVDLSEALLFYDNHDEL